jgi:L-ribulose-5-phosphate 3-epimerase
MASTHRIGIMQGRLSPQVNGRIQAFPLDHWRDEFPKAQQLGLEQIEWIFDTEDQQNPISHPAGRKEIRTLSAATAVKVGSICADYFMSEPLLHGIESERSRRRTRLEALIEQSAEINARYIVLPFVDESRIKTVQEQEELIALLSALLPHLEKVRMELHLEMDLVPRQFSDILAGIASPRVKITYDIGNSASFGYDPIEEFAAYGRWIGSVHIKDRRYKGATVPLGHGDADFCKVIEELGKVGYPGNFILQVARGLEGGELAWARLNLEFARNLLSRMRQP